MPGSPLPTVLVRLLCSSWCSIARGLHKFNKLSEVKSSKNPEKLLLNIFVGKKFVENIVKFRHATSLQKLVIDATSTTKCFTESNSFRQTQQQNITSHFYQIKLHVLRFFILRLSILIHFHIRRLNLVKNINFGLEQKKIFWAHWKTVFRVTEHFCIKWTFWKNAFFCPKNAFFW